MVDLRGDNGVLSGCLILWDLACVIAMMAGGKKPAGDCDVNDDRDVVRRLGSVRCNPVFVSCPGMLTLPLLGMGVCTFHVACSHGKRYLSGLIATAMMTL